MSRSIHNNSIYDMLKECLAVMRSMKLEVTDLPGTPVKALAFATKLPLWLSIPFLSKAAGSGRGGKMPSFHIDLYSGRPQSEVEFLHGAIVREGKARGIPTPVKTLAQNSRAHWQKSFRTCPAPTHACTTKASLVLLTAAFHHATPNHPTFFGHLHVIHTVLVLLEISGFRSQVFADGRLVLSPGAQAGGDLIRPDDITKVKNYLLDLQDLICTELESEEPDARFIEDIWDRAEGGGGRSRMLENGQVFEQGGVNFSYVRGISLPASATAKRPELANRQFHAMGVSLVIHPENPYVPTSHANVRFLIAEKPGSPAIWWFGGGFDLTPFYPFKEDVIHWHGVARTACQPFGNHVYPTYKHGVMSIFFSLIEMKHVVSVDCFLMI